jgi:hypothetical protein
VAVVGLAIGGLIAQSEPSVARSIENSNIMHRQFQLAASRIEQFRTRAGRLPTAREFGLLAARKDADRYEVEFMPDGFAQCDDQAEAFASIPSGTYVLTAWRGEWSECYAPASGRSTLLFNASEYAIFGSQVADGLAMSLVGLLAAIALWFGRLPWMRSRSALDTNEHR